MAASREIRVVLAALNGRAELAVKALSLDVVANLVAAPGEGGTPVHTGWARANWVPSIGAPRDNVAGSRALAEQGSLPGDQQAGVAAVASTYKLARGPVYITNNVPYILRLDAGHSRQAPAGFIRRAVEKAVKSRLR